MGKMETDEDFPEELRETVKRLEAGLEGLQEGFSPLVQQNRSDFYQDLDALTRAKLDLVSLYSINSLFWILIKTLGHNPQASDVKTELGRVRTAIARCKEIEDRAKRPRVEQDAAKRMVTSGLWQPGEDKIRSESANESRKHLQEFESAANPAKKRIRQYDV